MKCDMCKKDLVSGSEYIFGSLYYSSPDEDKKAVNASGGLKVHICQDCVRRMKDVRSCNSTGHC